MAKHGPSKRQRFAVFIDIVIDLLLYLLVVAVTLGLAGGVIKTFLDLTLLFDHPLEEALRTTLLNVLIMLALLEVLKTVLSYIKEGRVRVTFIIDTVLIVMLNEIIANWFKGGTFASMTLLLATVLTLIVARIFAIRYSPGRADS